MISVTPSPPPVSGRRGEAGYNLVMLAVAVTLLNIALAASLPAISGFIQREKEEELVFRGLQYAEAIRCFQRKFQRPPVRLEELIESEPRSIRQLWKDPMTDDGKWAIIFQGQDQGEPLMPQEPGPDDDGGGDGQEEESGFNTPKPGEVVATGPIVGVRSKSSKASFLVFNGRQRYDEWRFTVDLIGGGPQSIQGPQGGFAVPNPAAANMIPMNSRWIGRPFDQNLFPGGMQPGGVPQPQPGLGGAGTKPQAPKPTADR